MDNNAITSQHCCQRAQPIDRVVCRNRDRSTVTNLTAAPQVDVLARFLVEGTYMSTPRSTGEKTLKFISEACILPKYPFSNTQLLDLI